MFYLKKKKSVTRPISFQTLWFNPCWWVLLRRDVLQCKAHHCHPMSWWCLARWPWQILFSNDGCNHDSHSIWAGLSSRLDNRRTGTSEARSSSCPGLLKAHSYLSPCRNPASTLREGPVWALCSGSQPSCQDTATGVHHLDDRLDDHLDSQPRSLQEAEASADIWLQPHERPNESHLAELGQPTEPGETMT